ADAAGDHQGRPADRLGRERRGIPRARRLEQRVRRQRHASGRAQRLHGVERGRRAREETVMRALASSLACAAVLLATSAAAQPPAWQTPRTPNGKPDFSGFWSQPQHPEPRGPGATTFTKEKLPPFVPGGEALFYKPHTGDPFLDEPRAFCMPSGFPSAFFGPYPVQIVQT